MGHPKVINLEAVKAISAIENLTERHAAFLVAMNEARELQADLARRRGLTVYELYHKHGAGTAARLLGISRASLYRIIAEHAPDEVKQARREAAVMTAALVATALLAAQAASVDTSTASAQVRGRMPSPEDEHSKGATP
jgi:hypothetical protein